MTDTWITVAIDRVEQAIEKISNDIDDGTYNPCEVCRFCKNEYGIMDAGGPFAPHMGYCRDRNGEKCPAMKRCKQFTIIIDGRLGRRLGRRLGSRLKALKIHLSWLRKDLRKVKEEQKT